MCPLKVFKNYVVGGEGGKKKKIPCRNSILNCEAGSVSQERKDLKHKACQLLLNEQMRYLIVSMCRARGNDDLWASMPLRDGVV